MRKILFLLLCIASYSITYAGARGETFVKDGVIYTIASEYITQRPLCRCVNPLEKLDKSDTSYVVNEGEVFVSGVTVSDSVVVIPACVKYPSSYCRKDTVNARYQVLGIGEKAFEGAKLNSLVIPYGLKFIGKDAFRNMELSCGVLSLPPVRVIKTNAFYGLKAKVLFLNLEDNISSTPIPIKFDKTFQNTDSLPEFYVVHSEYNVQTNGLDKKILYTIGENVFGKWKKDSWEKYVKTDYRSKSVASSTENVRFET